MENGSAKAPVGGQLSGASGTPNQEGYQDTVRPSSKGQRAVGREDILAAGTGTHRGGKDDATSHPETGHLDKENPCPEEGHVAAPEELHTWDNNIASHRGKQADHPTDTVMANVGELELSLESSIKFVEPTNEIIRETQFHLTNRNIYNDILASIGLDSPTTSQEKGRGSGATDLKNGQGIQRVSTPIRNSASSLIALGKHVLTPRQGRMWEARNKSPLGG